MDLKLCYASQKGSRFEACGRAQGTTGNVHDCEFDGNVAVDGGAVFRGSSNGNLAGSVFNNNTARQNGGAVYDSHIQVPAAASCWIG